MFYDNSYGQSVHLDLCWSASVRFMTLDGCQGLYFNINVAKIIDWVLIIVWFFKFKCLLVFKAGSFLVIMDVVHLSIVVLAFKTLESSLEHFGKVLGLDGRSSCFHGGGRNEAHIVFKVFYCDSFHWFCRTQCFLFDLPQELLISIRHLYTFLQ